MKRACCDVAFAAAAAEAAAVAAAVAAEAGAAAAAATQRRRLSFTDDILRMTDPTRQGFPPRVKRVENFLRAMKHLV